MYVNFWELFLLAFVFISGGYAFLASCTTLLYKNRALGQLSPAELKVKQGTASTENRLDLFVRTFFASLFTYQVYLLAGVFSGIAYLVFKYLLK